MSSAAAPVPAAASGAPAAVARCKAYPKCQENHEHHYCRLCKSQDADHRSNECTNPQPQRASAAPAGAGEGAASGATATAGGAPAQAGGDSQWRRVDRPRREEGGERRGRAGRDAPKSPTGTAAPAAADDPNAGWQRVDVSSGRRKIKPASAPEGDEWRPAGAKGKGKSTARPVVVATGEIHRRLLLSVLNKITNDTYARLSDRLLSMPLETYDMLQDVIELLHKVAVTQRMYCAIFARLAWRLWNNTSTWSFAHVTQKNDGTWEWRVSDDLCSDPMPTKEAAVKHMQNILFRRQLLICLQKQFDQFCQNPDITELKDAKDHLANVEFAAELINENVGPISVGLTIIQQLVTLANKSLADGGAGTNASERCVELLLKFLDTVRVDNFRPAPAGCLDVAVAELQALIASRAATKRSQFMAQDLLPLLQAVQAEAVGGAPRKRTTAGSVGIRAANYDKARRESRAARSGTADAATAGAAAEPASDTKVEPPNYLERIQTIVSDFAGDHDMETSVALWMVLVDSSAADASEAFGRAITAIAMDKTKEQRLATGTLLQHLMSTSAVNMEKLREGLEKDLELVSDLVVDAPNIATYLGEVLSAVVSSDSADAASISALVQKHLEPVAKQWARFQEGVAQAQTA